MERTLRDGIVVDILGDSRPFSLFGMSIGYRVRRGPSAYLIDCGAPVFTFMKPEEVANLTGLFGTHSHDDHKRWFSDIALYKKYAMPQSGKLRLITTETIHEEYLKNSRGALERTLSDDRKRVVEIPYDEFVDPIPFGPRARYRIVPHRLTGETYSWRVVDADGVVVDPRKAKVVVNHSARANRPRMLFRDDESGEWIEPESYYTFAETSFYEPNQNPLVDEGAGLTFRALKAPVWHGPPTVGIEIATANEKVIFSSDTVYDPELWWELTNERRPQRLTMTRTEFDEAYLLYGNINDFIERTWSRRRYEEALKTYEGATMVHDVAEKGNVVHTEYAKISRSPAKFLILTHSPDHFVSLRPVAVTGKSYMIHRDEVLEMVEGDYYRLDADIYMKDSGRSFVGYRSPSGPFVVTEREGELHVQKAGSVLTGRELFRVDLFVDMGGRYFPYPEEGILYRARPDGRVERHTYFARGSRGKVVRNVRQGMARRTRVRPAVPARERPR